jgi:DNA-directed RNA polymerase specialized sigma24 family protein
MINKFEDLLPAIKKMTYNRLWDNRFYNGDDVVQDSYIIYLKALRDFDKAKQTTFKNYFLYTKLRWYIKDVIKKIAIYNKHETKEYEGWNN